MSSALSVSNSKGGQIAEVLGRAGLLDHGGDVAQRLGAERPGHDPDHPGRSQLVAAERLVGHQAPAHVDGPALGLREPLGRPGVRIELLLLIVQPGHPVHEGMRLPVLVDLGVFDLARGEPLVLLAQLGGQLGDRLEVGLRELAASQITSRGPRRRAPAPRPGWSAWSDPRRRSCSGRRSP